LQENDGLRRRLAEVDGLGDKLSEYDNRMGFLTK